VRPRPEQKASSRRRRSRCGFLCEAAQGLTVQLSPGQAGQGVDGNDAAGSGGGGGSDKAKQGGQGGSEDKKDYQKGSGQKAQYSGTDVNENQAKQILQSVSTEEKEIQKRKARSDAEDRASDRKKQGDNSDGSRGKPW
jgi:hypothetical protein